MAALHYRELLAWQRAMKLVGAVYALSASFPRDERFGLTNQIRRCAVSIPSNIAEGQGRGAGADFARFLRIALASKQEVETQLLLSIQLCFVTHGDAMPALALADEVGRLTAGLLRSLSDN